MPSKSKAKSAGLKNTVQSQDPQNPSASTKTAQPLKSIAPASKESIINNTASQKPMPSLPKPQSPQPTKLGVLEDTANAASGINRKKQKRRLKEAAKRAATEAPNANSHIVEHGDSADPNGYDYGTSDYDATEQYGPDDGEDVYYTDEASRNYAAEYGAAPAQVNGYTNHDHTYRQSLDTGKKKKKKAGPDFGTRYQTDNAVPLSNQGEFQHPPPPPPPPVSQSHTTSITHPNRHGQRDRIWNTSTAEERERIKEFWLSLGEGDRRGLVRIEKEAVLKKMKEQQKHSCSCTVCGRKRTAIEEELEVLYDAYYEELETYANHQQFGLDASAIPPPRSYARPRPPLPQSQYNHTGGGQRSHGHVEELGEDDDAGDEEEYSDEDEDDDISEDEIDRPIGPAGGIFNFGNSLTAQGGILTVADDLLKNDGKKFIEMMEQLAERRMQREEEAHLVASGMGHPSMRHGPPEQEDDGYDDEEDDEDYNSEEEDEFEDDEMEAMSEEQRMEEGRRMFQIFAARMFEQRVLTAYREKVSAERQRKLIEELAEDEQLGAQREAKKAKEAQKKRDKRQKLKQAKDEEKAKRDADRAAEEAAARALEEKKAEEQRRKKEEQRRRKEAEKKVAEEERKRKEEEKQRQFLERKEQQAEAERRQREQKEREKKKREEAKVKEREEREAREKETREKKERETAERLKREATAKAEDAKEYSKKEEAASLQATSAPKRHSPATFPPAVTPVPSSLLPPNTTSSHPSPRLPIATPVLPKAPTPGRVRQKSFQESRTTSPKPSQPASSSTASPATSSEHQHAATSLHSRKVSLPGPVQLPQQHPRFSPIGIPPASISQPPGFAGVMPITSNGFPSAFDPPMSPMNMNQHAQHHPPGFAAQNSINHGQYRPVQTNNMPFPQGMNGSRPMPIGQTGSMAPPMSQGLEAPPLNTLPNNVGRFGVSRDNIPSYTHSRNQSASSNISPRDLNQRQAPIQRPSSVNPHQQAENLRPSSRDVDDLSNHLGSSALLDDTDVALESSFEARRGSVAMGGSRAPHQGFGAPPGLAPIGTSARTENGSQPGNSSRWPNTQQTSFGPPGRAPQSFASAPGFGRPTNGNTFGSVGTANRSSAPRGSRIRIMVCSTCDKMTAFNPHSQGFHVADQVLVKIQAMMPRNEPSVHIMEMLQFCDTEGNAHNGGGWFEFKGHEKAGFMLKHHTEANDGMNGRSGPPPGEIGSPIVGSAGINLLPIGSQTTYQPSGGFPPSSGY